MRQFYLTYPDKEICYTLCSKLSWSHNRLIMRVQDDDARHYYLQEAPQVEVCGETAVVRYSYWRKREGLVKCTLLVTQKGDSISFGKERKEVLIVRG